MPSALMVPVPRADAESCVVAPSAREAAPVLAVGVVAATVAAAARQRERKAMPEADSSLVRPADWRATSSSLDHHQDWRESHGFLHGRLQ